MTDSNSTPSNFEQQEEDVNFKDTLIHYLAYWKWILLSVFLFIVIAFLYLKTVTPHYKSTSKVLVKEENKGGMASNLDIFQDLGISNGSANLENEIEIFKSLTLLKKVVTELDLNIQIDLKKHPNDQLFQKSPILLKSAKNDSALYEASGSYILKVLTADSFSLEEEEHGKDLGTFQFGKALETSIGSIVVGKSRFFRKSDINKSFTIVVSPLQKVAIKLKGALDISTINDEASVLGISLEGPNIEKNNAIISTLIRLHEQSAIEDKNEITKTTSEFINERMKLITQELSDVEVEGQEFKTDKSLTDLTSDAQLFIEKNQRLEAEIMEVSIQLQLAEYMKAYLAEQKGYNALLPSNLGFEDPAIVATIAQYNTNVLERNRLLQSSNENNPVVRKLENQLEGIQRSLVVSLNNMVKSLKIKQKTLESEERINQSKIASIPEYEREFRSIARQQQIKETLYLYLLQKREENEIAMAATIGNVKIIDEPYSDGIPVSPKTRIIFLGAFLLGLIVPIIVIYLKDLLDNKVRSLKDIEQLNLPYAGDIPINDTKDEEVVKRGERSAIAEAFRMLRTNMNFLLHGQSETGNVIAVTSSIKGEGKTFTALNLAYSIGLTGKSVLLIGMDLRSPKLTTMLGLPESRGVSNYLVDQNLTHEMLISKSPDHEHVSYMISGTIPPNPSELLLSKRMGDLIEAVKQDYDYIVIDTAPVGMVVDTQLITPYADLTLYVVRANYADKRLMQIPLNLHNSEKIKNIAMILNGMEMKNTRNYYGYGYGYGYGDSSEQQTKKSFFSRFRK